MDQKKLCFVIMGYGVKTDYATGRELDLDKTYKNIIKPAVQEAGLECKRADEIIHSGTIDVEMFEYLISADIVIADLSNYNPNAFYELGVRHALRPYTTIAIAEQELKEPFDVSHTVIRKYEHLGKDIGYDEVMRFREELKGAIKQILNSPKVDSPVFTYLKELQPPVWNIKKENLSDTSVNTQTLSTIIESAKESLDKNDFIVAKSLFKTAHDMDKKNAYIIQKLVLSTYKSKVPTHIDALREALSILNDLSPENSTDPETLGLAGAIYKRLWEELGELSDLNRSIYYYEKGFYIKNDYYNGINLAYLLNVRGSLTSGSDSIADYVLANRIRRQVIEICQNLKLQSIEERSDKYWILATLEEAYFGLEDYVAYALARDEAIKASKSNWERDTTEEQIEKLKTLLDNSPLKPLA